jgi:glutamine amidotransferase
VPSGHHFYFVHSYYAEPSVTAMAAGLTEYGVRFCSFAADGSMVATQFHPEKSGLLGLKLYDNFVREIVGVGKRATTGGSAAGGTASGRA